MKRNDQKNVKKLSLKREVLRALTNDDLTKVGGAAAGPMTGLVEGCPTVTVVCRRPV